MRDIKFRIWDDEEEVMIENKDIYSLDFRKEIYFSSVMVDGYIFDGDERYKLMQYTGLKDMNGKEIYEDDIIEIENGIRYKVVFNRGCFKIQNTEHLNSNLYLLGDHNLDCLKVIGNEYEGTI